LSSANERIGLEDVELWERGIGGIARLSLPGRGDVVIMQVESMVRSCSSWRSIRALLIYRFYVHHRKRRKNDKTLHCSRSSSIICKRFLACQISSSGNLTRYVLSMSFGPVIVSVKNVVHLDVPSLTSCLSSRSCGLRHIPS